MKNLREKISQITILYETAAEEGDREEHERVVEELLSLFKQQMKEITPRKFNMETFTKTNPMYKSYKGFNVAIDQILKNIESL